MVVRIGLLPRRRRAGMNALGSEYVGADQRGRCRSRRLIVTAVPLAHSGPVSPAVERRLPGKGRARCRRMGRRRGCPNWRPRPPSPASRAVLGEGARALCLRIGGLARELPPKSPRQAAHRHGRAHILRSRPSRSAGLKASTACPVGWTRGVSRLRPRRPLCREGEGFPTVPRRWVRHFAGGDEAWLVPLRRVMSRSTTRETRGRHPRVPRHKLPPGGAAAWVVS